MNTRSSTASRKRHMTVDFSSRHAENTSCVADYQSNVDGGVIEENSSLENDLKKAHEDLAGVYEEEANRTNNDRDQSFEEKDDLTFSCGVTTRSSSRPGKRSRTISPPRSINSTPESSKSLGKRLKTNRKPQKRQWESWAPKEKDCFFEAVLEHGKDFDKIHTYLLNGNKRRGELTAVVKNKDQVRHFYYRTLNKISKYIPEAPDLLDSKKTNYEVRCLICYGELRKKFRCLKEKDGKKLTELISTGKTTVRHHGRNLNIRAPVCRALKKLNVVLDEPEHVPNKIMIEFIPNDNKAWSIIQGLAQNPRLRTTVPSRKSLCSLLRFLLSKWKLRSDTNITLSPSMIHSYSKPVSSKGNDSDALTKSKQAYDGGNDCLEEEQVCDSCEPVKDGSVGTSAVLMETVDVITSDASNEIKFECKEFETSGDVKEQEIVESSDVQEIVCNDKWDISNSSNITIADVYRKLGHPRKVTLSYSLSKEGSINQTVTITSNALEHLVKLAAGEFSCRTDVRNGNKKDPLNKSVSKVCPTFTKPNRVSRSTSKSGPKPPKLAPKFLQGPSLVVPSVVPSVINQVSASVSARNGNHVTFGFTPINSFQHSSPFLPKMKKSRMSRVVVQRTLLPRPSSGVANASDKESVPVSVVSSPSALANSGPVSSDGVNTSSTQSSGHLSRAERQILPRETGLCVESLINIALEQYLPENVSHSPSTCVDKNSRNLVFMAEASDCNVCTEEIDCGVAGGGRNLKEASSLVDAIQHLDDGKESHAVQQTQDLLDNLKSSEDEDPFKLMSPPHVQQFHPEAWLNEESSDFSLSNLFANMENSPVKQRSSILDTPKKSQSDIKMTECSDVQNNFSKYSHPEPDFCDMVDESSVDYVKKFRDLAKKMTNDSETVSNSYDIADSIPSSNSTVSFKALLSDATSKD